MSQRTIAGKWTETPKVGEERDEEGATGRGPEE